MPQYGEQSAAPAPAEPQKKEKPKSNAELVQIITDNFQKINEAVHFTAPEYKYKDEHIHIAITEFKEATERRIDNIDGISKNLKDNLKSTCNAACKTLEHELEQEFNQWKSGDPNIKWDQDKYSTLFKNAKETINNAVDINEKKSCKDFLDKTATSLDEINNTDLNKELTSLARSSN